MHEKAANLLYQGPWVAERLSAMTDLLSTDPEVVDKTVKRIAEHGQEYSAQQPASQMALHVKPSIY